MFLFALLLSIFNTFLYLFSKLLVIFIFAVRFAIFFKFCTVLIFGIASINLFNLLALFFIKLNSKEVILDPSLILILPKLSLFISTSYLSLSDIA